MENDEETQEVELDEEQNNEVVETDEDNSEEDTTVTEDKQIDWKAEALKQKAINKRISDRINKPEVKPSTNKVDANVTTKDAYALMQAGVHIDDFDEIVDYAKYKKISVQDALKSSVIKTILADKLEFRKTSEVSNTGASRKGVTKVSDDVLLSRLSKGDIPEKGSEEAERIFWARRGGKR